MTTVDQWTGLHTRALRRAMRMSVRAFAAHLGIAVRTISKWEQHGAGISPRPDMQAVLDTTLQRCDPATRLRFEMTCPPAPDPVSPDGPVPGSSDHESWSDDLDRAAGALNAQNFSFAAHLLDRWLGRFDPHTLDQRGLHLYARGTTLRGDLLRDQGIIAGPLSAGHTYTRAQSLYQQLHATRRAAQLDLSLAVIDEMSGRLDTAVRRYQLLADDQRLDHRDRTRALLWVGTTLDKQGDHDQASRIMTAAGQTFDDLTEPEDWSVTQQKIALAHRGAGRLDVALQHIELARSSSTTPSPLQRVRLDTAYGHILLSDTATRNEGFAILDQTAATATTYGMNHQARSIETIRRQPTVHRTQASRENPRERAPPAPQRRPLACRAPALGLPPTRSPPTAVRRRDRSGQPRSGRAGLHRRAVPRRLVPAGRLHRCRQPDAPRPVPPR
ncbi:helix-turn-helix transcriptional regulator [Actinoplanes sp. NPDC049802]|uniref:helix-turn-helix domain-containing protein n=1 Tax=Actinoplanes sp. NPDC049802 TaxID=3154742 RepID=UPI0033CA5E5C